MDYNQYAKRIVEKTTQNPDLPPPSRRIDEPKNPRYPLRPEDIEDVMAEEPPKRRLPRRRLPRKR